MTVLGSRSLREWPASEFGVALVSRVVLPKFVPHFPEDSLSLATEGIILAWDCSDHEELANCVVTMPLS